MAKHAQSTHNRNTVMKNLSLSPLAAGALAALEDLGAGSGAGAVVEQLLRDEVTGRLRGAWEAAAAQVLRARERTGDPAEIAETVRRCIVGLLVGPTLDVGGPPHVPTQETLDAVNEAREAAGVHALHEHHADLPGCSHKGTSPAPAGDIPLVQVRPPRSANPDAMAELVRRAQGARDALPSGGDRRKGLISVQHTGIAQDMVITSGAHCHRCNETINGGICGCSPSAPSRSAADRQGEPVSLDGGLRRSVEASEQGVLLCVPCARKVKEAGASGTAQICRPCLERVLALATPAERAAISAVVHHLKRETVEHGVDTPRAHRVEDLPADERRKVERAIGKA